SCLVEGRRIPIASLRRGTGNKRRKRREARQVSSKARREGGGGGGWNFAVFEELDADGTLLLLDTAFRQQRLKAWQYVDPLGYAVCKGGLLLTERQTDINAKNGTAVVLHIRRRFRTDRRVTAVGECKGMLECSRRLGLPLVLIAMQVQEITLDYTHCATRARGDEFVDMPSSEYKYYFEGNAKPV